MPNEQTPLVRTVRVDQHGPRYRAYPHSTFRRFCTIALSCTLILVLIGFLVPFAILPDDRHNHRPHRQHGPLDGHNPFGDHDRWALSSEPYSNIWPQSDRLTFDDLKDIILQTPDEHEARKSSQYYTAGPHLAGKNLSQALWTRDKWQEAGVKADIVTYDVYINYPVGHRLALLKKNKDGYKVKFEASLEEDEIEDDPTTSLEDRIPTFHGYSASGNVTAPYVFVNFGTFQDFEDLRNRNVSLKGKIALAKYGRNFRGLKVKRAQELGMVGVVMYSDPQEDGEITELNGYKPYPEGPARNPSSVQRGSTQFLSMSPCLDS
jgi:N-acetylated-alpha-linked acidic dipeptidase